MLCDIFKISTDRNEFNVSVRVTVDCVQVYRVSFTTDGKMERKMGRRFGAASVEMCQTTMVKKELEKVVDLPACLCSRKDKVTDTVQAAQMRFLRRVAGISRRDGIRSSHIQRELGLESLLHGVHPSGAARGITCPDYPGSTFRTPRWRWKALLVRSKAGRLCLAWCHRNPTLDKQKKIHG